MKTLLSLFIGLMTLSSSAFADRAPIKVQQILIKNAPIGKNLAISAFYASGSHPCIGANGTVPYVRTIMAGAVRAEIHGDGTAQIPETSIIRYGFEIPNLLILVIHSASQGEIHIQNIDGKLATSDGPIQQANLDPASTDFIRMVPLQVTLNSDKTGVESINTDSSAVQVAMGDSITVDLGPSSSP